MIGGEVGDEIFSALNLGIACDHMGEQWRRIEFCRTWEWFEMQLLNLIQLNLL